MKDDEKMLVLLIASKNPKPYDQINECWYPNPHRDPVPPFEMHDKRLGYILEKWDRWGWIDWGVSIYRCWITDKGCAEIRQRALDISLTKIEEPIRQ